jgi:hypothetical protein
MKKLLYPLCFVVQSLLLSLSSTLIPMPSPQESASEQLRIIRSLMERATIYRSISALTAFLGGLLSLGACMLVVRSVGRYTPHDFLALWSAVLLLTALSSIISLWRGSLSRKEPFFSSGLRLASISLAPCAILTVGSTAAFWGTQHPYEVVPIWIAIYGIALLSTQHFAPKSLIFLGWSFVLAGVGLMVGLDWKYVPLSSGDPAMDSSILMALTFGLFHLIYASAVWLTGGDNALLRREGADV